MHYTIEQLSAFIRGILTEEESHSIAEHIRKGCQMCSARLSVLEKVKAGCEASSFVSPPEELTESVKRIFSSTSFRKRTARRVRELIASLVYDSYLKPAHTSLRSVGTEERQVLLRAGDYEIDYRITGTEGRKRFIVTGQFLSHSAAGLTESRFRVVLKPQHGKTLVSPINELGEFEFPDLAPLRYQMYVASKSLKIRLGTIDLR